MSSTPLPGPHRQADYRDRRRRKVCSFCADKTVQIDYKEVNRLRRYLSERAKIELSTVMETEINLPFITADASGPKHLQMRLTRAKLEQLCADLIERSVAPCKRALEDAKLSTSNIDEVVLVGRQGESEIRAEEVANLAGTINYEVTTSLLPRVVRVYRQGGVVALDQPPQTPNL